MKRLISLLAALACLLGAFVAPFGGVEKRLGTNPIAVALPAEKHLPVRMVDGHQPRFPRQAARQHEKG